MKHCSYCGRENEADALNCRECGTEFRSAAEELPPLAPEEEPVTICNYASSETAQIARSKLEAADIQCWTLIDNCGGMIPVIGNGITLRVSAKDVERASAILRARDNDSLSKDEEPLAPDLPKPVIVAGVWLLYGPGFVANIILCVWCLNGTFVGVEGFFFFWASIALGSLCAYLLCRSIRNYQLQKRRLTESKRSDL